MKGFILALSFASCVALAFAPGCGSSSAGTGSDGGGGSAGSGGGGADFFCSIPASDSCFGYSNLTSDEETAEKDACSAEKGSVVSSCPTAKLVGCCTVKGSGAVPGYELCYYDPLTASTVKTECTGLKGTFSTSM
jgi:hypothetical protein